MVLADKTLNFVHGWGFNPAIWHKLTPFFTENTINTPDLGFISDKNTKKSQKSIYITHSLGTLWALKHDFDKIEALIIINGFTNFTDFVDKRTLLTMQKRLKRDAAAQMNDFWNLCGAKPPPKPTLDNDKLHEGLGWLINWDISEEIQKLNAPIISLAGAQDPLLPLNTIKKQWQNFELTVKEDGGHMLPLTHPEWCADKIKDFIREHA